MKLRQRDNAARRSHRCCRFLSCHHWESSPLTIELILHYYLAGILLSKNVSSMDKKYGFEEKAVVFYRVVGSIFVKRNGNAGRAWCQLKITGGSGT